MAEENAVAGAERPEENTFEASARALSEFVIRAIALPVTLLLAKPSAILKSTQTGNYRPLPSPFLLALVAGVVASGITSNLDKLNAALRSDTPGAFSEFVNAVVGFYGEVEGLKSLLFSLPFVGMMWLIAGLASVLMGRGLRNVEPLFAGFSFCLAAVIEVAAIVLIATLTLLSLLGAYALPIWFGVALIALIYATKLVRMIFLMRRGAVLSWVGAGVASLVALAVVSLSGAAGGGLSVSVILGSQATQRLNAEKEKRSANASADNQASQAILSCRDRSHDREDRKRDLDLALHYCDRAVDLNPNGVSAPSALRQRGFVHLLRDEPVAALADYNAAIRSAPWSQNIAGRGLAHLYRKEWAAAYADYDLAVKTEGVRLDEWTAEYFYGRGLALLGMGRKAEGEADIAAAVAQDSIVESRFAEGLTLPPIEGR